VNALTISKAGLRTWWLSACTVSSLPSATSGGTVRKEAVEGAGAAAGAGANAAATAASASCCVASNRRRSSFTWRASGLVLQKDARAARKVLVWTGGMLSEEKRAGETARSIEPEAVEWRRAACVSEGRQEPMASRVGDEVTSAQAGKRRRKVGEARKARRGQGVQVGEDDGGHYCCEDVAAARLACASAE
jgi:hypothetical protein